MHSRELTKLTFQDITHPDDLDNDLRQLSALHAGAIDTYSMDKRYIRKDGSIAWVSLSVSLVRGDAGEPRYHIAVAEDISERKLMEKPTD